MDTNKPLSLFLVAILAASVFTVVGLSSLSVQRASAQDVTIETSADDHGGAFFGGMLQVIIEDENADDDDDTIDVEVTVEEDGGNEDTGTFTIADTNDGSQRFELFLVHVDAITTVPADPENADTDALADAEIIDFGAGATDMPVAGFELYDTGTIEIEYDDVTVTIDYEDSTVQVSIDRETPYGTTSIVYLTLYDQDGNLDPTEAGDFAVDTADIADLLDITGGAISTGGDVDFEETGDNTAMFEATLQLNSTDNGVDNELVFDEEVVSVEATDLLNYEDVTDGNNTSTDTDEVSFEIDNEDGEMDAIGDLTFAGELKVTVRDDDQNVDSQNDDEIAGGLVVEIQAGDGLGDEEAVTLEETDDNTGVFEIDLNNNELRIAFLANGDPATDNNGILEFRSEDIEEDILVEYVDPLADDPDNNATAVVSFTTELALTPGSLSAPEEVGVTDEFTVTLTDPDLNDNPRIIDSYTWLLTGASPFDLTRAGESYSEIYTMDIIVDGEDVDFGAEDVSVTMRETQVNSGIFEFEIDMDDLSEFGDAGADLAISDGDDLEIEIDDFMADTTDADEDDVTITIGKPSVNLDFSTTSPPLPPEAGSPRITDLGDTVLVTMTIVDPILNNQTNIEQTFDFTIGDDEHEFLIEIEGADGLEDCELDGSAALDELDECDLGGGVDLDDVLDVGDLEETGENTGVFEIELEFTAAGTDSGDWQDAEFTFTYHDDEGEEETAGFTFRGNDGIVTVDQASASSGTEITITVEDQDLNLDGNEVDEFESGGAGGLLIIETEDDDIAGVDDDTFEETGEDTGVFTATFTVGEDIPLVDVASGDQASNILITYDDDVDSTGGGGDEIEVNVPVVSSTGQIQVTPELVGPATTLTVLIIDSDLDDDASSVDEYDEADLDGKVEFSSSRNEVGEDGPDIEETGPNTGVFMFELELVTDEELCADDDLDGAAFDATGGDTESSIGACPGDLIAIRYEDDVTGSGGGSTVSAVIEVMSWDPEFVADKESYSIGDRVTITISDPDANTDPDIANTLSDLRVTSDSDRVGEEFSAIETGRDTGVFRLTFGTTSGTAGGSISVSQGDDITVEYTDAFPADFAEEEEDKDFLFSVPVGGIVGVDTTTVTPPQPQDPTGQALDEVSAGQQVILSTTVVNQNDTPQDFAAIIEVRDANDITVFLAWQTGTLSASGQNQVGLSWTPDNPGDYTVRTFVISDLNNPQVLSEVAETEITVS